MPVAVSRVASPGCISASFAYSSVILLSTILATTGIVENGDVLADRRLGRLARLQDEDHHVVLQCQRLRQTTLSFPGKRVVQIIAGAQRPMQVLLICWRLGKARIVIGNE